MKRWNQMRGISITKKLVLYYVLFFFCPLVLIVMAVFHIVSGLVMENINYSATQAYEQTRSFLEYKIDRMRRVADMVATDQTLNAILADDPKEQTDHEQLGDFEAIKMYLQTLEDETDIYRLRLYVNDDFLFVSKGSVIEGLQDAAAQQWYPHFTAQTWYFAPGAYLEVEDSTQVAALMRTLIDMSNYKKRVGILRIDTKVANIQNILRRANPTEGAVTYLVNAQQTLVTASQPEMLDRLGLTDLTQPQAAQLQTQAQKGMFSIELENQTVFAFSNPVEYTDWTMITLIPQAEMTQQITRLRNMLVFMVVLLVVISLLVGTAAATGLLKRIFKLIASMQQVKQGDLEVNLDNHYTDEIGVLYDNYNDMLQKTRGLLAEQYKMGQELKSAELNALHAQINPHFLYNTLEMVNWLGYQNRPEDIHSVVVALSKFYRLTLNRGQEMLTLEQELAHVGYFVRIQSLRFCDSIRYEVDVPDEILAVEIPKLTLQPLVENAILHGILEKPEKQGTIRIHAAVSETEIILQVQDDGVGMEEDVLLAVFSAEGVSAGSHYGLGNVHRRLQLYFGEAYGLSFTSVKGQGTVATVRLPPIKAKQ